MKSVYGILLLSALAGPACAGDCALKPVAVLPLGFAQGGQPMIHASIDGVDEPMIVDTGSDHLVISYDAQNILQLPTLYGSFSEVQGVAGGSTTEFSRADNVALGAAILKNVPVLVSALPANNIAGLIGADSLRHFAVDLDFPGRQMTLYDATGCTSITPPWQGSYASVKVTIDPQGFIIVPVSINGQIIQALFDTGSSTSLLSFAGAADVGLDPDDAAQIPGLSIQGVGDNATSAVMFHNLALGIGGAVYQGVSLEAADFPGHDYRMIVGGDYMRKRNIFISYATNMMFVAQGN
jgi:predicted aspartyl protease